MSVGFCHISTWISTGIYMSPPYGASLPPPIPFHPSRLSQSTRFELPASYRKCPLATYYTYGNVYVSVLKARFWSHICTPRFVALFTVAKMWKRCKCPLVGKWISKMWYYTYNGMLLRLKKEGSCDICYNTAEPWGRYTEWNQPVTKGQILYDSTYMRWLEIIKTENMMITAKKDGWMESYCLVSTEFKFYKMKGLWGWWWWWLHNIMWYLISLHCTLKNG